ncbi:MAG TPA: hypothetical protein VMP08_07690, partial [Anaerolineae bacterium]|nr:hypothetical protein [Anaerolineae bacterium]
AALVLIGWQIVGTLRIYPYYFTFFNEIAGGPERGRYLLSDSNLDWGQDLVGLKDYVDQQHITNLNLSYFGNTPPSVYGLQTYALPPVRSAMHGQGAWWLHRFYPLDPAPGTYAISVANLMGGIWNTQSDFAYFRDRQPEAAIGNSIYMYAIAPRGPTADLSLAGLQIDQIDPATYQTFNTNDVRPRWFDATTSLIAAPGETWIAVADNQPIAPEFKPLFAGVDPVAHVKLTDEDRLYALYHFDLSQRLLRAAQQARQQAGDISLPVKFGDTAELLGYNVQPQADHLTLVTYWRAGEQPIAPLRLFAHVLDADGNLIAQSDRLDAAPEGWRAGDIIAQAQRIDLPPNATPHSLAIGLYNPDTQQRLPTSAGDELILNNLP